MHSKSDPEFFQSFTEGSTPLLALRLVTLTVLVVAMTIHLRSLRVFRWEQSVSGGVLVTFCLAVPGLALCAGTHSCGGKALQVYLCGSGATLLAINAAVMWRQWDRVGELTLVVAEFLDALGVPLRRQVFTKVFLSAAAALCLILDLIIAPLLDIHKNE